MFQLRFHQCSLDNQCLRRTIGRRHCWTHAILVYGDAAQRGLRLAWYHCLSFPWRKIWQNHKLIQILSSLCIIYPYSSDFITQFFKAFLQFLIKSDLMTKSTGKHTRAKPCASSRRQSITAPMQLQWKIAIAQLLHSCISLRLHLSALRYYSRYDVPMPGLNKTSIQRERPEPSPRP